MYGSMVQSSETGGDWSAPRQRTRPVKEVVMPPHPTTDEVPSCRCGCGSPVNGPKSRFLRGHNRRGALPTDEHKRHLSESLLRRYQENPQGPKSATHKNRISDGLLAYNRNNPRYPNGTKRCTKCGEEKPLASFRIRKSRPRSDAISNGTWIESKCKRCESVKSGEDQRKLKERDRERFLRTRWRAELKSKYGITLETYESMLAEQDDKCAICHGSDPASGRWDRLAVDHDHQTGAIRGLLCRSCNHGIGLFLDDIDNLQRAIDYLKRHMSYHVGGRNTKEEKAKRRNRR